MAANYGAHQVINGTFGELWIDSDYIGEVTGFQAKITYNKSDIYQCGEIMSGVKITSAKGAGTIKCNKINSRMINYYRLETKTGKFPVFTIISKLADPDAMGSERVKLTGVQFDEMTLPDWEANKPGEESVPFTFSGFKTIDRIDAK